MTIPPVISSAPTPPQRPEAPRPMFNALAIASSGLTAQRVRMDVIAQNLANAETTHTAQGGPYHRRVVNLEAILPKTAGTNTTSSTDPNAPSNSAANTDPAVAAAAAASTNPSALAGAQSSSGASGADAQKDDSAVFGMSDATGGVRVSSIQEDTTPGPLVYDPANPDSDANGYVRMPNVSMTDEMIDLMNARRLYEANATVFQVARAMLHKAIDI